MDLPNLTPEEMTAVEAGARVMRIHGVDVCVPWEGSMDDRECEVFVGFVEACRQYASALPKI